MIICLSSRQWKLNCSHGDMSGRIILSQVVRKLFYYAVFMYQDSDCVAVGESEHAKQYGLCMAKFFFNYAMLTINSFGLQNALERSAVDIGHFFARCHASAVNCAQVIRDEIGPLGYLQYAPDSHFVQASYAVLSLLKVRRCHGLHSVVYPDYSLTCSFYSAP